MKPDDFMVGIDGHCACGGCSKCNPPEDFMDVSNRSAAAWREGMESEVREHIRGLIYSGRYDDLMHKMKGWHYTMIVPRMPVGEWAKNAYRTWTAKRMAKELFFNSIY